MRRRSRERARWQGEHEEGEEKGAGGGNGGEMDRGEQVEGIFDHQGSVQSVRVR